MRSIARIESLAARRMASCDGAAGAAAAAGLPLDGLGAGSIWVGSSAEVRSSVDESGQLACCHDALPEAPSSPSNHDRQDGSTLSGDALKRAYSDSIKAGLTLP